jgi:hypothetical protein
MSLPIQKAEAFTADYERQFAWYVEEGGADGARRFGAALDQSLHKLAT